MKIAVLTHNASILSQKSLNEIGHKRGHAMRFVYLPYCYTNLSLSSPIVYYKDFEKLGFFDAILPRINEKQSAFGTLILQQFETSGVFALNSSISIAKTHDKLKMFQQLARKEIPLPMIGAADSPKESEKLIELVGGAPLIVRVLESNKGKGTVFADTYQAALSVINAFKRLNANILVYEYIKESAGRDIRCVIVGNKVVAATQRGIDARYPKRHRFFLHDYPVKITADEKSIVISAAKAMELNFATVDFIRSNRGPLILDMDPSPNIEVLEKNSKIDITTELFKFIEKNIEKKT